MVNAGTHSRYAGDGRYDEDQCEDQGEDQACRLMRLDSRRHGGTQLRQARLMAPLGGLAKARARPAAVPSPPLSRAAFAFPRALNSAATCLSKRCAESHPLSISGVFVCPSQPGPPALLGGLLRASYDIGGAFPCYCLEDQTIPTARLQQLPHIRLDSSAVPCKQAIFALPSLRAGPFVSACVPTSLQRPLSAVGRPLPRGSCTW